MPGRVRRRTAGWEHEDRNSTQMQRGHRAAAKRRPELREAFWSSPSLLALYLWEQFEKRRTTSRALTNASRRKVHPRKPPQLEGFGSTLARFDYCSAKTQGLTITAGARSLGPPTKGGVHEARFAHYRLINALQRKQVGGEVVDLLGVRWEVLPCWSCGLWVVSTSRMWRPSRRAGRAPSASLPPGSACRSVRGRSKVRACPRRRSAIGVKPGGWHSAQPTWRSLKSFSPRRAESESRPWTRSGLGTGCSDLR